MLIWSGWGIMVVVFVAIGLFVTFGAADVLEQWLPYGPAQSVGTLIGGLLATTGVYLFARWREQGEGRVFVDEATGERIEVRPSAGSLFFIPTRFWTWIVLALTLGIAALAFNSTPLYGG
ncbi:MAG TPA: hypothetical protein VEA80_07320 [Vitreimonas sp.]|uniref:hypothetical protein n=1 Tax=Vitreimonas sp. TaxID=3069702 RepID=UPI002D3B1AC0|nr:hypothetical protein [Vitreimonas sp.]HYD87267.1 hypothetical protein [Vitreimonas sp.]